MRLNKKNILLAVTAVLIITIAAIVVLNFMDNDKKETKKTNNNENLTITDDEIVLGKIREFYLYNLSSYFTDVDFTKEELPDETYELAFNYIKRVYGEEIKESLNTYGGNYIFPGYLVSSFFQGLLNKEDIVLKDIICKEDNMPLATLNQETKEYTYNKNHSEHEKNSRTDLINYKIYKKTKKNNTYTYRIYFLLRDSNGKYMVNNYPLELDMTYSGDIPVEDAYNNYFVENIKNFKDAKLYEYSFEKIDNQLYLTNFKVIDRK